MVFQKKPVYIEAFRLGYDKIPVWFQEQVRMNNVSNIDAFLENVNEIVKIKTLEGVMNATQGDYIIKGVKGEIYPCKAEIFNETYDFIKLRHIEDGEDITGVEVFLDEASYLGNDAGDIIVWDENHKIFSEANELGNVIRIIMIDKNNVEGSTFILYENGQRKLNKIVIPQTFSGQITSIDKTKIAYEFFRVKM